ncbi:barstar family protein [Conchiformibius steedae]|uniref:barstar family protein n=1 Tax=Conchiformibius steedae TaxID=153493 RepID=UPI0026F301E0|nr:barstar family protein [Conchiformibius steedae]
MKIYLYIHHINILFSVNDLQYHHNGLVFRAHQQVRDSLTQLQTFDCEFIFINKNQLFKLYIYECHAHQSEHSPDTLVFMFTADNAMPQVHANLLNWIDFRFRYPTACRFWLNLNEQNRFNWLRLGFELQKNNPIFFNQQVCIDGLLIQDKLSFLCELGEQLVSYGYMGSDLDGLDDALHTGIGGLIPLEPFDLTWVNFATSEHYLGRALIADILDILHSVSYCRFHRIK